MHQPLTFCNYPAITYFILFSNSVQI
ncbi:hypothetical protein SSP1380 [Staphylococcus saprophyticus subsp. saprophyticus ATCC 15305]|uniref:Uncharacterized protein n=1 Tax=Staphylococcus saprophyticus subsp. saprophyticus (strain ATCC 15305 / DSM 20229 / NCIMB 8711 / NCTC 7292 / S-41) TaxID=342451 RepID=Q49XH2_STAS1|nr:hypothetical protein SSP1380 [Staphylococcus saprophyticus subsp. saprophyticus ATCC 15305] [Staphylococcus saprophyticus subsp. saprophyticus ATCC 15305 = NCTC 7292]